MKLVHLSFFVLVLLGSVLSATTALAQTTGAVTCPPGTAPSGTGLCFPNATGLSNAPISTIIQSFLYWLLGIFGFLAVIAFVISGIQYLTSAGNDKQVETAKKNMQYSIIGVIVALGGLVVILAVGEALSGASTIY
ncbi:MAG: pilin [Patescibacteria group bacterium]